MEALELLAQHGDEGKILAGGQSLVPAMNFRLARPAVLIDVNGLHELEYVRGEAGGLAIGALARHAFFHRPVAETPLARALTHVAHHIAHYPIRQRGTFGGSLSHADPASEWCLVASTLGAEITLRSAAASRTIPGREFFRGTFTTMLQPNELLTGIRFQGFGGDWRFGFYEFSRRVGDFALAMAFTAYRLERGVVAEARIGLGGISDRPIYLSELGAAMQGKAPDEALFDAVSAQACELVRPTGDIHASAEYRRDLTRTVVKRALQQASLP